MGKNTLVLMMAVVLCAAMAQAGTRADLSGDSVVDFATTMDMPFMAVGNVGNAPDSTGHDAVDYAYNIGKFEVTAGQYTEFLNAVAATDTYDIYHGYMDTAVHFSGCNIKRSGSSGSYTYAVAADWADRPVNFVGWGDAARFCNWLTNGMPTGAQDLTTTEDGSYFLNGQIGGAAMMAVTRRADALYVIPSEDEWYKAAHHANDGVTGNYFDYPTSSDSVPSTDVVDPDTGNSANFYVDTGTGYAFPPYYRTEVGEYELSASPYGAFDMAGNVWEWTEAIMLEGAHRGFQGGSYGTAASYLRASDPFNSDPWFPYSDVGFRIAEVPEPATMSLLALGGLAVLRQEKVA